MSGKHILKLTDTEAVVKCYTTEAVGSNIDISLLNDLTSASQDYVVPTSIPDETADGFHNYTGSYVFVLGIWWGVKKDKQLDVTRIINPVGPVLHSHYYLIGAGFYDYNHFADRVYANRDIRVSFDGPGHCILRLRKVGWVPKV